MLITLCYMYLWVRFQRYYSGVIRSVLYRLSGGQSSFTFCSLKNPEQPTNSPNEDSPFLKRGNKVLYITEPQVCDDDLSKWTLCLDSSLVCTPQPENIAFIIEATSEQRSGCSPHRTDKVLKWSDYCLPLAFSPGQPYRAVAEASVENFSRLGVALLEDRLQMENGLKPEKIVSVSLRESALKELLERQRSDRSRKLESKHLSEPTAIVLSQESVSEREARDILYSTLPRKSASHLSVRRDSDTQSCGVERRPSRDLQEDTSEHHHMDGHHLHLSSCHECLELENSTILSVKFASVENIPDLPDDFTAVDEEGGGISVHSRRVNESGKPPNVLVFTGGCEEQFQKVRSLLAECIDTDSYAIYPLRPQQALSEPWLENALLLVLATDQTLTPQLQLRFLSYLSQGGKLLGLSSSLCPAGLTLQRRDTQKNQICTLNFTKSDSTELRLSVLASGSVYVRDPQDGGGGEVELWGEISTEDEKHMAIVRVTHGADSGEAVLCQVRLETAPDADVTHGFSELKMSNARRYEVLTEILMSLGLSCELSQVPPHSPLYLLHIHQEGRFLPWLRGQVSGSGGVLRTQTGSLRVIWGGEEPPDLADGERALYTDPPQNFSEHFSLQTYKQNLQTQRLGQTVIYADVTTTTMDLLEGLMLQLPQEMGLIAIAARQTQGKGRGCNAWLSPVGCGMFTLHLQLPLNSPLGQRVSFLQHLVALAVVESVRTLPGYEDIDLRLKWPNDIYYSNLMKLGGVLVNSTITGQTFNLLIGCGFNVSNSNPTICINDLVLQQNCECGRSLDALSTSQLIARTVSLLERFIADFQLRGPHALLPLYYKRWIHSGMRVRLWSEDGPEAEVVGLDENGFLQVFSQDQGVVSVQPDGNSFDMLRNLVMIKSR
ncbi:biotin--protein ligase isoform X2 [Myxocyprinus asiaticus]|uniref:biotin--protein ligase isoform X2 n=1 Tax=Myxocyprinus asiaticus TaxID=70543 RepID=UPI0022239305|nr:biotin--protein ligase isoform X2 [Myxocyprinus asiaticus]